MSEVRLITITPDTEKNIMYMARVSNPKNQNSENTKLIDFCIKNQHWSIFEMSNMVVEINTSRAISAQILRHRSFSFQEYSQRYSPVQSCELYEARSQDTKNRQNSIDDMDQTDKDWFQDAQLFIQDQAHELYKDALTRGIAKEQARFLLPMSASTKLYMNGTIRSWITYLMLRLGNGTQLEHREIARKIRAIFCKELPIISEALGWK